MPADDCPSREELCSYSVGLMPDLAAALLERHIASCQTCEAALGELDNTSDQLVSQLRSIPSLPPSAVDPANWGSLIDLPGGPSLPGEGGGSQGEPHAPQHLGRYQLLAKIGEGGTGVVYKARHTDLHKIVALKMLARDSSDHPTARARFEREMRAVGQIDHPNVVCAHDAGEFEGRRYLAMEYVDGVVLSRTVAVMNRLRVADACEIVRQLALGLSAAHAAGLIHRDVKPSNAMVSSAGIVKLLDLGLVRAGDKNTREGVTDEGITGEGRVVGTATYIAPEQALQHAAVDSRVDLYGAGATLFALLAGRPPFSGPAYDTPMKQVVGHVRDEPPSLEELRPDVPRELAVLLGRLLAKRPEERIQTAQELAEALAPFATGADLIALVNKCRAQTDDTLRYGGGTDHTLRAQSPGEVSAMGPRPRLWRWLGVAAFAALGICLFAVWRQYFPRTADRTSADVSSEMTASKPESRGAVVNSPTEAHVAAPQSELSPRQKAARDAAVVWLAANSGLPPTSPFITLTTGKAERYLGRNQPFLTQIGGNLLASRQPAVIAIWSDQFIAVPLPPEIAGDLAQPANGETTIAFGQFNPKLPAEFTFDLSALQIGAGPTLPNNLPLSGRVHYQRRTQDQSEYWLNLQALPNQKTVSLELPLGPLPKNEDTLGFVLREKVAEFQNYTGVCVIFAQIIRYDGQPQGGERWLASNTLAIPIHFVKAKEE